MPPTPLRELGGTFLRLGLTSFGGPAAHIALFRDEFVRRRGWLDDAEYLDMIGAANLIPGPTSTEVAMHLGHRRAGWPGLVVAGVGFILPAALLVGVLAAVYATAGDRPEVGAVLGAVAPVVLAVIVHAGWSLGRAAVRGRRTAAILVATVLGALVGVPEPLLLVGMGLLAVVAHAGARLTRRSRATGTALRAALLGLPPLRPGEGSADAWAPMAALAVGVLAVGPAGPTLLAVFGEFLAIGTLLFGSGYVLVAVLQAELVHGLGWLTEQQLIDAIAVGQATPGPYYTTATFVGYVIGGPAGAVVATIGIFLPGFVAVAISIPILARIRRGDLARAFLDGVNAAAVALLGIIAIRWAAVVLVEPVAMVVAAVALLLLLRGAGAGALVAGGALLGIGRLVVAGGSGAG